MQLSDTELRVLGEAEFSADASIAQLSKRTGLRPHVVNHALQKLLANDLIQRRVYIDSYLLGTSPFLLLMRIPAERELDRAAFFRFLEKHPNVSFVATLTGQFNCWLELRAPDIFKVEDLLIAIGERFGDIVRSKEILAMPEHLDFPRLAGAAKRERVSFYESCASDRRIALDDIDVKLLRAMSTKDADSMRVLAQQLGIPASTALYRLQRLRKEKLILGNRFWIDLKKLGHHLFLHLIEVKTPSTKLKNAIKLFARKHPAVATLRCVLGAWDFTFETHHQYSEGVGDFMQDFHAEFSNQISRCETLSVLHFLKSSDCTI